MKNKSTRTTIIVIACIAVVLCLYYSLSNRADTQTEDVELTEVQDIVTRDLDDNYPATPREVIKFYNRIVTCFYNEEYTDDELYDLGDTARKLFDDELLENNPRDEYFESLKESIADYRDSSRTIVSTSVQDSDDVTYKTVDGESCAYVRASYFMKAGDVYTRTYQMYVLRKDDDGNWKILVFYQVDGDSSDDDD